MKKIFYFILFLIFIPFLNVEALSCRGATEKEAIDLDKINNFSCTGIKGEELVFTNNEVDVSNHFSLRSDKTTIDIVDKNFNFAPELKYGLIVVVDKSNDSITGIFIKNKNYVEPTTTTTTTTKKIDTKTYTVTLDPNNGNEITTKTCDVTKNNTTCSITLPKIDEDTFNGWGTAKTCKEGNIGTIKVDKDITYYACYEREDSDSNIEQPLYLKTLTLKDKDTGEIIDFGTFSIKKTEYTFKVLNNIENIDVITSVDDNIEVEIIGNDSLKVGENKITISLKDESNNKNEYLLNVNRLKEDETINNINYLKSLVIGGYELNFNKEQFFYNLTIQKNIEKLEITAIPETDENYIEINNNENLIDGSIIKIDVIGDNEETTTYSINITKESNTNYLLFIGIGLILVLIIVLIILIIIKSNKNKKTTKNKKNTDIIEVLNI